MKQTNPIRIILADDHEIFRDGFRVMLKKQPSIQLVGEASDGAELLSLARELKPDVVVTDIKMPGVDGLEATRQLTVEMPDMPIIALSMFNEEHLIVDMLEAGAKGYLIKNAHKNEIIQAIISVYNKEEYYCEHTSIKLAKMIADKRFGPRRAKQPEFTEKEKIVIRYICQQLSNKEMAVALNLSIRTVEGYRADIQEKIGARNAAGVVIYAIKNNIYKVE